MCSSCAEAHKRIQALQSHSVTTLEAIKRADPRDLAKQLFCRSHKDEPLKLFCETCSYPICRECTVFDHKEHNYYKIGQVIDKEKRDIAFSINEASYKIPGLEKTLSAVKNMQIRVKKKAISSEKDVDTFIDTQIRILQQIRSELKTGVSTVTKAKLHALQYQDYNISQHLQNLQSGVQFARQCVTNGSDCEVLTVKKQIVTRLTALSKKEFDSAPCQDDGLAIRVNKEKTIRDMVPELAWIDSSTAMASLCSLQVIGGEPNMIYTTFCNQGCEFVITLRDHFGQRLRRGDSRVHAAITECPATQQEVWGTNMKFLEITDNDDGTYNMSYVPLYSGKYKISVAVDRCHIKGSPFCWYVSQKMERISMHKLDLLTNENDMLQGSSTTLDEVVIDGWYCFSWRVKFRTRHPSLSPSVASTTTTGQVCRCSSRSSSKSLPFSPPSQLSLFYGCRIGVRKAGASGSSSETSFTASSERSFPQDGSLSNETWKELNKGAWFWCDGFCYSPSDPSGSPSNITSYEDGDIFVLFLNPIKKTLIIYNRESEQSDFLEGLEFPLRPLLQG